MTSCTCIFLCSLRYLIFQMCTCRLFPINKSTCQNLQKNPKQLKVNFGLSSKPLLLYQFRQVLFAFSKFLICSKHFSEWRTKKERSKWQIRWGNLWESLYVQYTVCIYLFGILLLKMVHFNFPASCKPFRLWKHQEDCDWPVKTKIKYQKKIIGSVCGCP